MNNMVVLQTDFGLQDGAVAAMYGVALSVKPSLQIYNLTHDIVPYDIWEASYRLVQTLEYWPEGTVFVSVVDPGVGTHRKSLVAKSQSGHYIVTPDNGTLTHIAQKIGLQEIREIDEEINRLPHSGDSYTFHGRDVYAYTAARLATQVIAFEQVGDLVDPMSLTHLETLPLLFKDHLIEGMVDILDVRFGNLWTNIPKAMIDSLGLVYGDRVLLSIHEENKEIYHNTIHFVHSFAEVHLGETLLYINSLNNIGIAINQGSFAKAYQIGSGNKWKITLSKG